MLCSLTVRIPVQLAEEAGEKSEGLWDSYRAGGEKGKHALKRPPLNTHLCEGDFGRGFPFSP